MKSLKQIREEYDDKFMSQVDNLPEELMLEDKTKSSMLTVPATKDMPGLLIFRRVSFRLYPNKQVVALYYSKLVDKYLSIPFGPTGNLNLSEANIFDTLDEACWNTHKQQGMKKKGNRMVPNCVPKEEKEIEEQGSSATRYTERPTYEQFKDKVDALREERLEENPLAALGAVGSAVLRSSAGSMAKNLIKKGGKYLLKKALGADDDKKSSDNAPSHASSSQDKLLRDRPTVKVSSSWETGQSGRTIDQVRQKEMLRKDSQASKSVAENKISDIRNMIKEGVDYKDLYINGRPITLNTSMAKRILEVYDSVNTKNKKIVEGMLNEDLESFKKLLNFSVRN
jgi:hypothetical protein